MSKKINWDEILARDIFINNDAAITIPPVPIDFTAKPLENFNRGKFVVRNKETKMTYPREFDTVMEALSYADSIGEETIVDML